mmetsp:Transcript_1972/g.2788  ORF Transcript_1972/g.2788 Transcript_1972/m.2788 type:complete len:94 (+) Transcript_1972:273-554(+)
MKKSFSEVIINLEKVQARLQAIGNGNRISWETFTSELLPILSRYLPTALDRMELHKNLVNELEFKHGFTLESLEQFWNMYYPSIDQPVSAERL